MIPSATLPPPPPPWWLFLLMGAIGAGMIGIGVYGIRTGRALVPRKFKRLLRLFGIEEVSPRASRVIGGGQCFAGGLILLAALTGPFWAGFLADTTPTERARQPVAAGPVNSAPTSANIPSVPPADSSRSPAGPPSLPAETLVLRAGHEQGDRYAEKAPADGLLVGLRVAKGTNWGGALQAVQPIYQAGTGYALGQRHGKAGGDEHQLLAKPGYAVGAINARAGAVLNAVQLVFCRVNGRRLDPGDRYESPWIGCEGGGPCQLDPRGAPITGLSGTWQDDLTSLAVEPTDSLTAELPLPTEAPPDLWSEPRAGTILGLAQGTAFTELAPEGGVLVGVRAFCDERPRTLRSLQPIYLVGDQWIEGPRIGQGGETVVLTVARPGFAVAGIQFSIFGDAAGLRLRYAKLTADGPSTDAMYESLWLGYEFDRAEQEAAADGRFVVGLAGYYEETLMGVGLVLVGPRSVKLATSPDLPPEFRKAAFARPRLRAGSADGTPFADAAPEGGLLVGLRCAKGTNWGGALQAVQPIYQVGTGYALGSRQGKAGGDEQQLMAKPGYAVGAIRARVGLALNALQLVFYRVDGQRLDPSDSYESPWVGCDGGGPFDLDAHGDPIIGVSGTWVEDLVSIGIEPSQSLAAAVPLPAMPPPEPGTAGPAPSEFRTWTSADGRSTVEARMLGADNGTVQLERRDGKLVTVPISKLSEPDIAYVRERP